MTVEGKVSATNVVGNNTGNTLITRNPYLYRGYRYDRETGLYYLNSRYYDPETGRFFNADVFVSTGQGVLGNNMFAYCNNNPISYIDPTGNSFLGGLFYSLFKAAIDLLIDALTGNGEKKYYDEYTAVNYALSKSKVVEGEVEMRIKEYNDTQGGTQTFSGTLSFYNKETVYDADLSNAVGKANYEMSIHKEVEIHNNLLFPRIYYRTVVVITIKDIYNFDEIREGGGLSNALNNWGYRMQQAGKIVPYEWETTLTKSYTGK